MRRTVARSYAVAMYGIQTSGATRPTTKITPSRSQRAA
jgi:hypothetical protein